MLGSILIPDKVIIVKLPNDHWLALYLDDITDTGMGLEKAERHCFFEAAAIWAETPINLMGYDLWGPINLMGYDLWVFAR